MARALKKPEEIAAVPADQPVLLDLGPDNPEPEPELKLDAEPAPQPEPEPEPEDNPLLKQVESLKRAEETAKQRAQLAEQQRDSALRERQQAQEELTRERGQSEQAKYDAVLNAISASQAEADAAQRDLEAAYAAGDGTKMAEAQRRLSTATARLVSLEDGKAAFEARKEEPPQKKAEPAPQPVSVESAIDQLPGLSSRQKTWLKDHTDAFTDQKKNARLGAAHYDAIDAGHAADTDDYFQFIEEKLGYRQPEPEPEPQRRSPPVSAPVSRDSPSPSTGKPTSTRITLSPEQREHARISGVDELTYAKGVQELARRKAMGMYPDRG